MFCKCINVKGIYRALSTVVKLHNTPARGRRYRGYEYMTELDFNREHVC